MKLKTISGLNLKGSSLVEVLTGMSVLSIAFLGGLLLLRQIIGLQSPVEQYRTQMLVRSALYETLSDGNFLPEELKDGKMIRREIKAINHKTHVYEIKITCYTHPQPHILDTHTIITTLRQFYHENTSENQSEGFYPPGNDGSDVPYRDGRTVWSSDAAKN